MYTKHNTNSEQHVPNSARHGFASAAANSLANAKTRGGGWHFIRGPPQNKTARKAWHLVSRFASGPVAVHSSGDLPHQPLDSGDTATIREVSPPIRLTASETSVHGPGHVRYRNTAPRTRQVRPDHSRHYFMSFHGSLRLQMCGIYSAPIVFPALSFLVLRHAGKLVEYVVRMVLQCSQLIERLNHI